MPSKAIRYMQDAKTHQAKAELFAAYSAGRVAVLIGSTETIGVGTNVQTRAGALHHLDARTTTIIEDDIRLTVRDTPVGLRFVASEWGTLEPRGSSNDSNDASNAFPRPSRITAATGGRALRGERADILLCRAWEYADRLNRLRRRQKELDEALTEVTDPPTSAPDAQPPPAGAHQVFARLDHPQAPGLWISI